MSDPEFDPDSFSDSEGELCRETGDEEENVSISPGAEELPHSSQGKFFTAISQSIDNFDLLSSSSFTTSTRITKRRNFF